MAEVVGLLWGDGLSQLPLHLQRVLGPVGDPQAAGDADAVGVAHIGRLAEHVPKDEVRGLAAHAGETRQGLHGAGDLAAVFVNELSGAGDDVPGLAVEKTAGADVLAHLCRIRLREALQRGEAGIEGGGHLVDPLVGALGGQAHREQQLIVFLILQRAQPVRIDALERLNDTVHCGLGFHIVHLMGQNTTVSVKIPGENQLSRCCGDGG